MSTTVVDTARTGQSLTHDGLLYRSAADYLAGVGSFLQAGIQVGQPAFVAVPGPNLSLLRDGLLGISRDVHFADMSVVGRNPARIMPAIRRFADAHPRQRVRFVGEPIWPGRSPEEISEATRHEAMLNAAFAGSAVDMLCPYDASRLDPAAISDVWRTHPTVVIRSERTRSPQYDHPERLYSDAGPSLPAPPDDAEIVPFGSDDLDALRALVQRFAAGAGLSARRSHDFLVAVNEIATNTVVHADGVGWLGIWRETNTVVCEVRDAGHITDPFAGRYLPTVGADHGRGLWLANQLCDLVQIRSSPHGTTTRLKVDLGSG